MIRPRSVAGDTGHQVRGWSRKAMNPLGSRVSRSYSWRSMVTAPGTGRGSSRRSMRNPAAKISSQVVSSGASSATRSGPCAQGLQTVPFGLPIKLDHQRTVLRMGIRPIRICRIQRASGRAGMPWAAVGLLPSPASAWGATWNRHAVRTRGGLAGWRLRRAALAFPAGAVDQDLVRQAGGAADAGPVVETYDPRPRRPAYSV